MAWLEFTISIFDTQDGVLGNTIYMVSLKGGDGR